MGKQQAGGPADRTNLEVPEAAGYVLGDVKIHNRPIEFGGQVADFVTVRLRALAHRIGTSTEEPMACKEPGRVVGLDARDNEPSPPACSTAMTAKGRPRRRTIRCIVASGRQP